MKLSKKIFVSFYGIIAFACCAVSIFAFTSAKARLTQEYVRRYESFGAMLGQSFERMESQGDQLSMNALRVLREREAHDDLESDEELDKLARSLGVTSFYVTDKKGRFIRSSDLPLEQQTPSIFYFCDDYRLLLSGESKVERTPIVIGKPVARPIKFTSIANAKRTRILEVSYDMSFIGSLMSQMLNAEYNEEVLSASLFSPMGILLGDVGADGSVNWKNRYASNDNWFGHRISDDIAEFRFKVPSSVAKCCECTRWGVPEGEENYYYTLSLKVSPAHLIQDIAKTRALIAGVAIAAAVISAAFAYMLSKRLVAGLTQIEAAAGTIMRNGSLDERVQLPRDRDEVYQLAQTFNHMMDALQEAVRKAMNAERLAVIDRVASQVAHDIRSPLAAVKMALSDLAELPEEKRCLIRSAVFRIEDIANYLLFFRKSNDPHKPSVEAALASDLVETIVSEKRTEYRARLDVVIESEITDRAAGLFIRVDATQFKNTLSNLVNNAVESLPEGPGHITIKLAADGEFLAIEVKDDGCGVSDELLQKLNSAQPITSTTDGNGIGVYSAHQNIATWEGTLTYASTVGEGTSANIALPICPTPTWFLDELVVAEDTTVVILDDDISIHHVWTERFSKHADVHLLHLSTPQEFEAFVAKQNNDKRLIFLVDYELLGFETTGLDLLEKHDLRDNACLVTSRTQDHEVRERAEQLGVRLLPKSSASTLPIRRSSSAKRSDLVLIDDDDLVRHTWEVLGAAQGLRVASFPTLDAFFAVERDVPRYTPIYVDMFLANQVRGDIESKRIKELGFEKIYLATGEEPERIDVPAWIDGVAGKEGPFNS